VFGFLIASTLVALRLLLDRILWETAFIEGVQFLFWWYLIAGVVVVALAMLAWAGDLGTEGARLRYGIAGALGWLIGLPRVPISSKGALLFLMLRRLLLGVGAYLLTLGLRAVGATFVWDEELLWAGGIILGLGLVMALFVPLLQRLIPVTTERIDYDTL
jgi:hypothetical protein